MLKDEIAKKDAIDFEEKDARKRILTGMLKKVIFVIGLMGALFHLFALIFYTIQPFHLRAIHLMITASLTFCLIPFRAGQTEKGPNLLDLILILAIVSGVVYLIYDYQGILYRVGVEPKTSDVVFATITFVILLEMGRRLHGYLLPIMTIICLIYAIYGNLFSGNWGHRGYSFPRAITFVWSLDGIYSEPLSASATFVVLFVLFGSFLNNSGTGRFFIDCALAVAGAARGGPAKVAVIASAFFGTLSGSAVSNVVTTGTFTIPLMKKTGYKPHFAGAVEAVASTGGQIMPPIMSAAAFIMAEMTGISYTRIAAAGLIPAILYFVCVFLMVGFEARNLGLSGLPKEQLPWLGRLLRKDGYLLTPIFVLLFYLIIMRVSPLKSAFYALISSVIISWFRTETRMGLKKIANALNNGMVAVMDVAAPCAMAGVIAGVMSLTGIGLKFSDLLLSYVGNSTILGLFAVMVVSLVLGMGVPTLAAYVICAVTAAPALQRLGIPPLSAHMFIFYFSALSTITPPIAISSFAAAGIAGAKPMQVGGTAVKIGIAAFVVPYMFIYGPTLLMEGPWIFIGYNFLTALIGVYALAKCVLDKQTNWLRRIFLGFAGLLFIHTGWITDLLGVLGLAIGMSGDFANISTKFRFLRKE
ncbi:MAG: TRAP transporter permease [Thermodesulfobacteriota bacterium]